MNPVIRDKLKPETRSNDLKMQKVQTSIIKSIIPLVSIIETLLKAQEHLESRVLDISSIIKQASDSIALSANANYELNTRRHEAITPDLNQDYKHLCSSTVPVTEYQFGNEQSKQLREMAEANQVSSKVGTKNKSRPH